MNEEKACREEEKNMNVLLMDFIEERRRKQYESYSLAHHFVV